MFNVSNNDIITITRGDTAATELVINLGTMLDPLVYDLGTEDKVFLGVCEPNMRFEQAIIKKVFTYKDFDYANHCVRIRFNSIDTEFLLPGTYYYSIKLYRPSTDTITYEMEDDDPEKLSEVETHLNEKVDTLIDRKKFIILE